MILVGEYKSFATAGLLFKSPTAASRYRWISPH